jgi:hypothetical protein
MQVKTTVRCDFTPMRMGIIKTITNFGKGVGKLEQSHIAAKNENGATTVKITGCYLK